MHAHTMAQHTGYAPYLTSYMHALTLSAIAVTISLVLTDGPRKSTDRMHLSTDKQPQGKITQHLWQQRTAKVCRAKCCAAHAQYLVAIIQRQGPQRTPQELYLAKQLHAFQGRGTHGVLLLYPNHYQKKYSMCWPAAQSIHAEPNLAIPTHLPTKHCTKARTLQPYHNRGAQCSRTDRCCSYPCNNTRTSNALSLTFIQYNNP